MLFTEMKVDYGTCSFNNWLLEMIHTGLIMKEWKYLNIFKILGTVKYIIIKMSSDHNGKGLDFLSFYRETMRTNLLSSMKHLLLNTDVLWSMKCTFQ